MNIKYTELCSVDFTFSDIVSYRMNYDAHIEYNYENAGRSKHLVFCQLKGKRYYDHDGERICTLREGDIIFLPHGLKYKSYTKDITEDVDGIGISFNICDNKQNPIFFEENAKYFPKGNDSSLIKSCKKILYSVMNPAENILRLKGEMYLLLDRLFSQKQNRENFDDFYGDIIKAINILEKEPENSLNVSELAEMCHMSESSFIRKFKEYSGGIAPIKYRNNIRFILAEELSSSPMTINEIAEKLGFYDGSHLCKMYKEARGYSLKRNK